MKAFIVQPPYSTDYSKSDEYFQWELSKLDECDESLDIILFPESCDVPCFAANKELSYASTAKYRDEFLKKASETAKRCRALTFVNVHMDTPTGLRNTTLVYDREGKEVFRYYKQHLTPGETSEYKLDSEYSFDYEPTYVFEYEGVRYGFLICYDFYFYEMYAKMARSDLDVIIGCSHQRSDTYATLETINKFCAYHCNAYLLRSSVSMGEDAGIGGCSCAVSPEGKVLKDMLGKVGAFVVEFDPKEKYYKPMGYMGAKGSHYEYIEKGRRPWKYRPAGSAICRHDDLMPYPRVCAHRGFNFVAPENTMPAYGAAVALGAEEIEFDVWATKDGVLVSAHDNTLERVSNGTGDIRDYTYEELLQFDFGVKRGAEFSGLKIVTMEEILQKFACHVIMNVHVKIWDEREKDPKIKEIVELIRRYDCAKWCYFMTNNDEVLKAVKEYAPDIKICVGQCYVTKNPQEIVDRAIVLQADKLQLLEGYYFEKADVERAHAHGIRCNYCAVDDPNEVEKYLEMGVDTILTNNYLQVANAVKKYKENGNAK